MPAPELLPSAPIDIHEKTQCRGLDRPVYLQASISLRRLLVEAAWGTHGLTHIDIVDASVSMGPFWECHSPQHIAVQCVCLALPVATSPPPRFQKISLSAESGDDVS